MHILLVVHVHTHAAHGKLTLVGGMSDIWGIARTSWTYCDVVEDWSAFRRPLTWSSWKFLKYLDIMENWSAFAARPSRRLPSGARSCARSESAAERLRSKRDDKHESCDRKNIVWQKAIPPPDWIVVTSVFTHGVSPSVTLVSTVDEERIRKAPAGVPGLGGVRLTGSAKVLG